MDNGVLFMGEKQRRRSSINKEFVGDSLRMVDNPSVMRSLSKHGDRRVLFSDTVVKVNKRLKMQERVFLVTEAALYNLDPSYKVKRRIPFTDLQGLWMSQHADNFFVLHVPGEYDYLMVSSRKTEIALRLMALHEKAVGSPLRVKFANKFEYQIEAGVYREVEFEVTEGGVSTQFHSKKTKQLPV